LLVTAIKTSRRTTIRVERINLPIQEKWKALLEMSGLKYHGMILRGEEGDRGRFRKENLADRSE